MKTPIMTHAAPSGAGPDAAQTRYAPFAAGNQTASWTTSLTSARTPMPIACTISDASLYFASAVSTGNWVCTLMKNGVATSVTGTITTGNLLTLTGTETFIAGDDVCWRLVGNSATPAQVALQLSCVCTGGLAGRTVNFAAGAASSGAQFMALSAFNSTARTDAETRIPSPTSFTVDGAHVRLSAAPGVGNSKIVTVHKNGSATAATVTISGTDVTGSISGAGVTFVQGDLINLAVTVTGTPTSSLTFCGLDIRPSIDGESLMLGAFTSSQSNVSTVYNSVNGQQGGGTGTESGTYNRAPIAFVARKMAAVTSTAPTSGRSRTYTFRVNAASSALQAAISNTATTAADNANSAAVAAGDFLALANAPSGSPAANTYSQVGIVAFVQPVGGSGGLLTLGVGA